MSAPSSAPTYTIEGALLKRSKRGAWQKRYFSTNSHYILYQRKRGGEFLGGVDLTGAESTITAVQFTGHNGIQYDGIRIVGLDGDANDAGGTRALREFNLQVPNHGAGEGPSTKEWIDALQAMQRAVTPARTPHQALSEVELVAAEDRMGPFPRESQWASSGTSTMWASPALAGGGTAADVAQYEHSDEENQDSDEDDASAPAEVKAETKRKTLIKRRRCAPRRHARCARTSCRTVDRRNWWTIALTPLPPPSPPLPPLPPSPHHHHRCSARRMSVTSKGATHRIEGALLKRSKRGTWQKRYFSTQGRCLLYQRKVDGEFLGGIDLSSVDAKVEMVELKGRDGAMYDGIRVQGLDGDAHSAAMGETRALRECTLQAIDSGTGEEPSLAEWHETLNAMRVSIDTRNWWTMPTVSLLDAAPLEESGDNGGGAIGRSPALLGAVPSGTVAEEVRRRRESRLVLEAAHKAALAEVHMEALAAAREATARMIADSGAQRRLDSNAEAEKAAELAHTAAAARAEAAAAKEEMRSAAAQERIRRKNDQAAAEQETRRRRESRTALEAAHQIALDEVHAEALAAAKKVTAQMIADSAAKRQIDADAQAEVAAEQARAAAVAKAEDNARAAKAKSERDALSAEANAAHERRRRLEAEAAATQAALFATKEVAVAHAVAMVQAAAAQDAAEARAAAAQVVRDGGVACVVARAAAASAAQHSADAHTEALKVQHDAELAALQAASLAAACENEAVAAQAAEEHVVALNAAAASAAALEDAHCAALAKVHESVLAEKALNATARAIRDDAEKRRFAEAAEFLFGMVWRGNVQWRTAMKTTRDKFVWVDPEGDVFACPDGINGARTDATPAVPFGAATFACDPDSDTEGTFRWESAHEDSPHKSDGLVFASPGARTAFAAALAGCALQTGTLGRGGTMVIDGESDDARTSAADAALAEVTARADMYEKMARDAAQQRAAEEEARRAGEAAAQRTEDEAARLAAAEVERRAEEAEAEEAKQALARNGSRAKMLLPPTAIDTAYLKALEEKLKYSDVGELLDEMERRGTAAEHDAGVISRYNFVAVVATLDEGNPEILRAAPCLFDAIAACAGHHTAPATLTVPEVVAAFSVASVTNPETIAHHVFAAYDVDDDGSMTLEDMSSYFKIVVPFLLKDHAPLYDETADRDAVEAARAQYVKRSGARADTLAKRTFDAVDTDLRGGIGVDEFQRWIEHRIKHGPSPANFRSSAKTFGPKKAAHRAAEDAAEGAAAPARDAVPKDVTTTTAIEESPGLATSVQASSAPRQSVTDSETSATMENSDEEDTFDESALDNAAGAVTRAKKASARLGKQRKAQRMSMALPQMLKGVEGILLKRSKRGQWQPRYFTCQSHYLRASLTGFLIR